MAGLHLRSKPEREPGRLAGSYCAHIERSIQLFVIPEQRKSNFISTFALIFRIS